jgi:hypothetical protein
MACSSACVRGFERSAERVQPRRFSSPCWSCWPARVVTCVVAVLRRLLRHALGAARALPGCLARLAVNGGAPILAAMTLLGVVLGL